MLTNMSKFGLSAHGYAWPSSGSFGKLDLEKLKNADACSAWLYCDCLLPYSICMRTLYIGTCSLFVLSKQVVFFLSIVRNVGSTEKEAKCKNRIC